MSTTPDRNEGTSTKAERGNIAGRAIRGLGKIVPRRHDSEAESSIYVPGPGRPIRTQLPNEYIIIDGPDKGTFVPRQGQRDLALEDDREEPADWLMRDAAGGRGSFDDSVILPFDEPLSEPAVRRGGFKQQRVVEPPVSQLLAGRDDPEMVPEVTYAHAVAILRDSNAPASDQNVVDLEDFLIDFYGYADENEMYEAVFGGQKPSFDSLRDMSAFALGEAGIKELPIVYPDNSDRDVQESLDGEGNFDSHRFQLWKAGLLPVQGIGKGTKESAKFVRNHRTAQAALAAVALAGIFSQIAVDDPFATGGSEQAHTQQLPNPGLPGAVGLPPGISIETPGRPVQGPNVPDAQANPVQENASKLSGNFSVKQAENVLDAAGDGQIGDLSYQFKIEKSGKIGWGTFDWSHANGLKSVGINLFDENNPSLNGDARWQLTMLAAKSLGVPVETLNTVYAGDTFNIKITPELAQKLIDLNVKVPDNILKSVGLLTATTAAQPDSKPVVAAPVTTEKHDDAVNLLPGSTGGNGSAGSVTSGSGNAGSVSGGFGSSLTTSIQAFLEQVQKNKVDLAPAALTPAADQFKLTDAEKANAYKVFEIRDNVNGPAQVLVSKLDNPEVGKVLFVGNRSILQIFENYQSQGLNIPLVQNTTAKLSSGFMDFSFRDPQTNNSYDLISRGFQALTLDKPEPVTTPVPTPTVVPQETGLKQGYKASALEKTDNGRVLKAIDESTGKTVEMNFDDKNLDKLDQMVKVSAGNHNLPVEFMMTEQRGVKGISFKNLDQKFIFVPFWQEENKDDDELDWLSFFTDSEKAFGQEIPAAKTIAISLAGILGISTISIYMTLRAAAKRRQEEEDEKVRAGSRVAAGGLA